MSKGNYILAGFNVAATPHDGYPYLKMLEAASDKALSISYHGKQRALLQLGTDAKGFVIGTIKTYIDIDPDNDWIDTKTGAQVDAAEQQQMAVTIGAKRPDYLEHAFIFTKPSNAPSHTMVVDVTNITIGNVERIITKIFNDLRLRQVTHPAVNFVSVTAIPDYRELEQMLDLVHITKIRIVATRKNPDDTGFTKDLFDDALERMRARRGTLEFTAQDKEGLVLSDEFKELAKSEARDGVIEIKGRDENQKNIDFSTKQKPLVVTAPKDQPLLTGMMESLARFKLGM